MFQLRVRWDVENYKKRKNLIGARRRTIGNTDGVDEMGGGAHGTRETLDTRRHKRRHEGHKWRSRALKASQHARRNAAGENKKPPTSRSIRQKTKNARGIMRTRHQESPKTILSSKSGVWLRQEPDRPAGITQEAYDQDPAQSKNAVISGVLGQTTKSHAPTGPRSAPIQRKNRPNKNKGGNLRGHV